MRRLAWILALAVVPVVSGAAEPTRPDFSGVWLPDSREAGRWPAQPPFTEAMTALRAAWDAANAPIDTARDDEYLSCMPYALPQIILTITQYPFEIVATPQQVLMHTEVFGQIRRIHMEDTPAGDLLPTLTGHSRGRWDGDQLVVETTHLLPQHEGTRWPSSPAMRIVERWSLRGEGAGGRRLVSEVTFHDPKVYREPVTVRMVYKHAPDVEVAEYICEQDLWDQHRDGHNSAIPWR